MKMQELLVGLIIGFIFLGIPYLISYFVATRNSRVKKVKYQNIRRIGIWGTIFFNVIFTSIFFASKIEPAGILLFYILWGYFFWAFLNSSYAKYWPFYLKKEKDYGNGSNNQTEVSEKEVGENRIPHLTEEELLEVENYIRQNKLKKAISILKTQVGLSPSQNQEIINFERKFTDIETKSLMGYITEEKKDVLTNKFTDALLLFLANTFADIKKK